jgi:flagellar basal-body rod modification protein FlgD
MSQIGAFDPTDAALRSPPTNGFGDLKSEDFIRVIFTELANQDPFQPNDSSALLEQLNSIRSIETDLELMDRLDSLVFENQLAAASSLIGKFVQGMSTSNDRVAGVVTSVIREGDAVTLELDNGWRVPIDSVEEIHDLGQPEGS